MIIGRLKFAFRLRTDENDPLHQVIGRKPTQSLPWHINICRQRIRENGSEFSAFSPTGTKGFHEPMKFAHFFRGNSHRFDADESVTDYLIESRAAEQLMRKRQFEEALTAYVAMASSEKTTDFQKSDALHYAALCARSLKNDTKADELASQIPIKAVAKTVQMENLLAQRKWDALVEQFGEEDLSQWPFWQKGATAFARAKAYVFQKKGEKAEADLKTALAFTSDARIRTSILATMGSNREVNLADEQGALEAYRQNYETKESIGAAEEFRSVHNAARILTRQGKFDEALKTIKRVNLEKTKGFWQHSSLIVLGDILAAAGKKEEALETYRRVLDDKSADERSQQKAEEAISDLEK